VLKHFINRLDPGERDFVTQRTQMWLREPALRPRYLTFVAEAEDRC